MENVTEENFEEKVLNSLKPVVVKVFTNSCPNCTVLTPIFEQTATDNPNTYSFFDLNAHENMSIAKKYKVMGVPALLFFMKGKLVDKKTGVIKQEKIEKRLLPLLDFTQEMADSKEITSMFRLPWKR